MPGSPFKWNRRAAVAVGVVGLVIIVYGLVKGSLWFTVLGAIVLLLALFHRRLKSFSVRASPGRIEAKGEFVADLGEEDEPTLPGPHDAPHGPRPP